MNVQRNYTTRDGPVTSKNNERHGLSYSRLYRIWHSMKTRCGTPSSTAYKHYGAKGITVCDIWKSSFTAFYEWAIENGYEDNLSIDRIKNDLGYYPDNCRWVTNKEQKINRDYCRQITFNGKTQCVSAWVEELGIARSTLNKKLMQGKTGSEAIEFCLMMKKKKENAI